MLTNDIIQFVADEYAVTIFSRLQLGLAGLDLALWVWAFDALHTCIPLIFYKNVLRSYIIHDQAVHCFIRVTDSENMQLTSLS